MASDAAFTAHICDQGSALVAVSSRRMFGEYALYADGKVLGFICDDTVFLKPNEPARALLGTPVEGVPYPGAKAYWVVREEIDDRDALSRLFAVTARALPMPAPKRPKAAAGAVANTAAKTAARNAAKKAAKKRTP